MRSASDVTYGFEVDPTNLRLEFREAHKQDDIACRPVAHFSRFHEVWRIRGVGDVGVDAAQRLELVFWVLSAHCEVPKGS